MTVVDISRTEQQEAVADTELTADDARQRRLMEETILKQQRLLGAINTDYRKHRDHGWLQRRIGNSIDDNETAWRRTRTRPRSPR